MPRHPRAGIEEGGVAPVRLADRTGQPLRRRRREDEVNVIGHEAIGPALDAIGLAALGEEIAVERVVFGLEEDRLTAIAALGDMVRRAGNGDAGDAGHGDLLHGGR